MIAVQAITHIISSHDLKTISVGADESLTSPMQSLTTSNNLSVELRSNILSLILFRNNKSQSVLVEDIRKNVRHNQMVVILKIESNIVAHLLITNIKRMKHSLIYRKN